MDMQRPEYFTLEGFTWGAILYSVARCRQSENTETGYNQLCAEFSGVCRRLLEEAAKLHHKLEGAGQLPETGKKSRFKVCNILPLVIQKLTCAHSAKQSLRNQMA